MAFKQGHQKVGGRQKGVTNKTTQETRELFNQVWSDNVPKISEALEKVYYDDPSKYLEILAKFAQYFVPKKVEQDTNHNFVEPPQIIIKKKDD